jgi:hypothetical protein
MREGAADSEGDPHHTCEIRNSQWRHREKANRGSLKGGPVPASLSRELVRRQVERHRLIEKLVSIAHRRR